MSVRRCKELVMGDEQAKSKRGGRWKILRHKFKSSEPEDRFFPLEGKTTYSLFGISFSMGNSQYISKLFGFDRSEPTRTASVMFRVDLPS